MPEPVTPAPETGYAPVNGLQMYYQLHGAGGTSRTGLVQDVVTTFLDSPPRSGWSDR
ncbi:hypothetical protein M8J71_08920 [Pseudarthrobacter sp. R1]|uniref:hypothetical protein n=1 Tax=Pseudarthrobacter sp. R1 TaxID=2944934 RepID=UPI00210DA511|nr:hypothetical protein [Pseudarthrobacter sp. R1]MCQ6270597.1 hypothetical protein [Pseudarthrobacter sp. R1]